MKIAYPAVSTCPPVPSPFVNFSRFDAMNAATCSVCDFNNSAGRSNPRLFAAANASIGNAWLWQAKQVFCSACPSAAAASSGSAFFTACTAFSALARGAGAVGSTTAVARRIAIMENTS